FDPVVRYIAVKGYPATLPETPVGNIICVSLGEPIMPILDPNGTPVTLAEYTRATGTATAKCDSKGTHITVHLSGLIPHGVYTMWVLVGAGNDGVGSLGKPDGSQNVFHVSASGEAD